MTEEHPPAAAPPHDIDWPSIRTRYERGQEAVKAIAESIGMQHTKLSLYAKAQGWLLRKKQNKAQSTQATLKRLKDILQHRLTRLEAEIAAIGGEIEQLNSEKSYRNLNTLVRTLDKVLELERNERRTRKAPDTFKHVDDAERAALADKIARLQPKRTSETAGGNPETSRGEGTEPPLALLGP